MRLSNLLATLLIGQLLNFFAPARAGDFARAYLLGQAEGESKSRALGTIAAEKLWDIWALLTLLGLVAFTITLPQWIIIPARGLVVLSLLALALVQVILARRSTMITWIARLGRYLPSTLSVRLRTGTEGLLNGLEGLRRPQTLFWSAAWSAATWGIGVLTNHFVLLALGLSLPLSASLLLIVVLYMGVAVPSMPGRVGVFEGLCIVVLALYGVDRDSAFAVGLVLHAVVFVPPILLALFFVWRFDARDGLLKPNEQKLKAH
jgi:uncharacterized protein (TIRG00374 family)